MTAESTDPRPDGPAAEPLALRLNDQLGVSDYRRRLTDEAMQAVESCVQGDLLLTAATVLMFDVRRLRRVVEENKTLTNGEAVRIPTSADEAALMMRLGAAYLRDHAPDRLTAETPNAALTGGQQR